MRPRSSLACAALSSEFIAAMTRNQTSAPIGIGVDVGGTKILACATLVDGGVLAEESAASPTGPDELPAVLEELLRRLVEQLQEPHLVRGVAIALPGLVDAQGQLHAAPNLGASEQLFDSPSRIGVPLAAKLSRHDVVLDRPVIFENDSTCAAVGEVLVGAAKGSTDAVVISFGTGIGAGIVANGALVRGHRKFAGEIGHMVIDPAGPRCPCGRHGCWELFASGAALSRLARTGEFSGTNSPEGALALDGLELVDAARRGTARAIELIEQFAHQVALGLSNVVELLDPERIVIAGGLANSADVLLEPIRRAFATLSRPAQRLAPDQIVTATLQHRAASIGAALLGLGHF